MRLGLPAVGIPCTVGWCVAPDVTAYTVWASTADVTASSGKISSCLQALVPVKDRRFYASVLKKF